MNFVPGVQPDVLPGRPGVPVDDGAFDVFDALSLLIGVAEAEGIKEAKHETRMNIEEDHMIGLEQVQQKKE